MTNKKFISKLFPITDFLISLLVWFVFWYIRKSIFQESEAIVEIEVVAVGLTVGLFWLFMLWLWGAYESPLDISLFRQALLLIQAVFIGTTIVFFVTFIDDPIKSYKDLTKMFLMYNALEFFSLFFIRIFIYKWVKYNIARGKFIIPTVIIGQGKKAKEIYRKFTNTKTLLGNKIIGYIKIDKNKPNLLKGELKKISDLEDIKNAIERRRIEEVIIALEPNEHNLFMEVINKLRDLDVSIKSVPDLYDYFIGNVRVTNILEDLPLIKIYPKLLSPRESLIKRTIDVVVSAIVLILLIPVFIILAIIIKLDSRGPVFYSQERIGKDGKPFTIYKFRTMVQDAEKFGPALAKDNDPRVTKVGKFLRKTRLDELPQFYNVLRGDMSLVGPRPERKYYIDKIIQRAPEYLHLLKVRPGITSIGQVKYGYAENIDQLVDRMKYDLIYIQEFSLLLDFKIMLYTIKVVIEGRGK